MTPDQARQVLRDAYPIGFPEDLFHFWEFTLGFALSDPLYTFIDAMGIRLEGPFKVLAGTANVSPSGWDLGGRYYDDPPEFVTVFSGDTDGLHWGYWFDDPDNSLHCCVADYYSRDAYEISEDGESLFEAFRLYLEQCHNSTLENIEYDSEIAENRLAYEADLGKYALYRERLIQFATGDRPEIGQDYVDKYAGESRRAVVADTFEGMGIVVPESLYRPLSVTDAELRSMAVADADLSTCVTEARLALANGFPGTALKLGKDLWIGNAQQKQLSYRLLNDAYHALNRPTLQTILHRIASVRSE